MTKQDIENTLDKIHYGIRLQELKKDDSDEIRVRIGRELIGWINGYDVNLIQGYTAITDYKTIWGYPVEIEHNNAMCIEVHIVKKLPIYKDNEPIYR